MKKLLKCLHFLTFSFCLLFFSTSCSSRKTQNPYRPSGIPSSPVDKKVIENKKKSKVNDYLNERYNLCTHKRLLKSAKQRYKELMLKEKRFGSNLAIEKAKYKKMIYEVGKSTYEEEQKFKERYRKKLKCTTHELRPLNI